MADRQPEQEPELPPEPRQRGDRRHDAEEELGLGGPGTEGKPGAPEGGLEPQIPGDVTERLQSEEELRAAAERLARNLDVDLDRKSRRSA